MDNCYKTITAAIDVGGGPSGPSIEGPFCRTVHLCRTLGDRKREKKGKKKREKNKEKRRKNRDKRERNEKKGKLQRFYLFSMHFCLFRVILCSSDSSFCRTARLCRTVEGRWRPDASHCPTSMGMSVSILMDIWLGNQRGGKKHLSEWYLSLLCKSSNFYFSHCEPWRDSRHQMLMNFYWQI